jgi:hypothetical protein
MKTRIIQTRFWDDEFVTEVDMYTQHLYIYLLTSQYINISGMFQLSPKKIQFECKLTDLQFQQAKETLEVAGKVFFSEGWVYVVNAMKNNNYTRSEDNSIAYNRELERVPTVIKDYFYTKQTVRDSTVDSTVHSTSTVPINKNKEIINKKSEIRNKKEVDFEKISQDLQVTQKDAKRIYEKMIDYTKAKGKDYSDYSAALRNWVRKEIEEGKVKQVPSLAESTDPLVIAARKASKL